MGWRDPTGIERRSAVSSLTGGSGLRKSRLASASRSAYLWRVRCQLAVPDHAGRPGRAGVSVPVPAARAGRPALLSATRTRQAPPSRPGRDHALSRVLMVPDNLYPPNCGRPRARALCCWGRTRTVIVSAGSVRECRSPRAPGRLFRPVGASLAGDRRRASETLPGSGASACGLVTVAWFIGLWLSRSAGVRSW